MNIEEEIRKSNEEGVVVPRSFEDVRPRNNEERCARLEALAAFLDTIPPDKFNYSEWVDRDWKGKPDLSCGTKACALGWATTMPEFRKLGLHLNAIVSEYDPSFPTVRGSPTIKDEFGRKKQDFDAIQVLFTLPDDDDYVAEEVTNLFQPTNSDPRNDPSYVAEKIRETVGRLRRYQ